MMGNYKEYSSIHYSELKEFVKKRNFGCFQIFFDFFLVDKQIDEIAEKNKDLDEIKFEYIENRKEEVMLQSSKEIGETYMEASIAENCKDKNMILSHLTDLIERFNFNVKVIDFDSVSSKKVILKEEKSEKILF